MYRLRDLNEVRPWSSGYVDDRANEVWRGEGVHHIASFKSRRRDEIASKAQELSLPPRKLK
jgi:hypothetical protein